MVLRLTVMPSAGPPPEVPVTTKACPVGWPEPPAL
jgi:hypothetical protein